MSSSKSKAAASSTKKAAIDDDTDAGWGAADDDAAFADTTNDGDLDDAWGDDEKKQPSSSSAAKKKATTSANSTAAKSAKKAKKDDFDDTEGFGDDDGGWGEDEEEVKDDEEEEKDEEGPAGAPGLKRSSSYTIMDQVALNSRQEKLVKTVAEELFVEPTEAGCMLRHFGWKDEKLKKEWWEDPTKVRKDVGLIGVKIETKAPAEVQCESAFCDVVPSSEATRLDCGHWFCNGCWEGFLTSQINDGATCVFASCMGMRCKIAHNHKFGCACNEKVPASFFARFVKDPALINKYTRWILNSFVEGQRNVKWCPKPGCENAVMYPTGGTKDIACRCGHRFCFSCSEAAHSPVPCDLVKNWLQREKSDDATQIWLDARTKQCPKCQVRIEKNKACNHMNCAKCGHHFCWLCKGPWTSHGSSTGGYYVCNKYNEEASTGKLSEEENKILANTRTLQKYTYYYKRFKSSQDAIGITRKLADKIEKSMASEDVAKYGYLNEAADRLIAARHVLQWTYCMAYYFQAGSKKQLFEYQQELLIGNTEALQDTMENSSHEQLLEKRKEIINKTSSIDHFRAEMVKQIERGDFEELLLSSADDTMDNWACSTCKKDNEKTAVHCAACSACRLHGEMDCKPCKDKKPPTAPAKAPAKGAAKQAPAKGPAKVAAT